MCLTLDQKYSATVGVILKGIKNKLEIDTPTSNTLLFFEK